MKHTPTPWRIGHRSNLVIAGPNTASAIKRISVADCPFTHSDSPNKTLPSGDESAANAARIVLCVNQHEALEQRCARLEKALESIREMAEDSMYGDDQARRIILARAVLSEMKEGKTTPIQPLLDNPHLVSFAAQKASSDGDREPRNPADEPATEL